AVRFRVIKRYDLILEQLIQATGVHFVLKFRCAIIYFGANCPTVASVEAFAPPAVEHAQVNPAVGRRFHPAGAACFQRTQRMVEPKIDSLPKAPRDVAIVVLNENYPRFQTWFATKFVNLLDQCFACFIAWMGFACKDELHWARRIVYQTFQPFLVGKQQCAALVSRKASRETDG